MTAEAILYKENDPLLRYAIYKAYKYRCAYTGKFLYDYSSMEKPRDFDPFGHAGFAHLWLQYD